MNDKLQRIKKDVIEEAGNFAASLGINRFAGQLYGFLYLSNKPVSLDEMVEELGISKAHVWTNVQALQRWGAVRKVWVKGSRKDYYVAELEVLKVVVHQLKTGINKRMEEANRIIGDIEASLGKEEEGLSREERETIQIYRERLKKIKGMQKTVNQLLKGSSILSSLFTS
jgi:DNA-binding transcriptional regulator GbsR (MarR family)